jgi:hypothetical protein
MGPGRCALILPEPWRSWREAGLEYLLGEPPAQEPICSGPYQKPVVEIASDHSCNELQPHELDWPEPWKGQLARLQRPKPVLWTYRELGLDLCGSPDPRRRELWATIIEKLGWPRGAVLFWPFSHVVEETLVQRTDLFWKGIGSIDPMMIVVFGMDAAAELLPGNAAYGPVRQGSVQVLLLPGPQDMLPDNRSSKRIVWEYLRQVRF